MNESVSSGLLCFAGLFVWGFYFCVCVFYFCVAFVWISFLFSFAVILSAQSREERNNIANLRAIVFTQATFLMTVLPEVCKILPVL